MGSSCFPSREWGFVIGEGLGAWVGDPTISRAAGWWLSPGSQWPRATLSGKAEHMAAALGGWAVNIHLYIDFFTCMETQQVALSQAGLAVSYAKV